VLTPTLRYQPAVIAHTFATLACLNPGRVILGIGTGEAMNENPSIGIEWPKFKERSERLAEAVALIRELWTEERVSFEGKYYRTVNATIYDRPEQPVPIFIAAGGPKAAALVGEIGDGFVVTSGKGEELYHTLLGGLQEGAEKVGRDPAAIDKFIEIKVSYDHNADFAMHACEPWAALALTAEEKGGTEDPIEMERLADGAKDRAHTRFIVSDDPDEVVEKIAFYVNLGFRDLVFHMPGEDQERALTQFAQDVLPRLRERWG
jgi:coenzyme F420-dependent glucose-6-phosphate dehydrogenase